MICKKRNKEVYVLLIPGRLWIELDVSSVAFYEHACCCCSAFSRFFSLEYLINEEVFLLSDTLQCSFIVQFDNFDLSIVYNRLYLYRVCFINIFA